MSAQEEKPRSNAPFVLARSRVFQPWWFQGLLAMTLGLAVTAGVVALGQTVVPLALAPLVLALWALTAFVGATVTEQHVRVGFGAFARKIPLDAIRDAKVATYDPLSFGGWGIKRAEDGTTAYTVPGLRRGFQLTYEAHLGLKTIFVSSHRPEEIVAAIEGARSGRGLVRVAGAYRVEMGGENSEEVLATDDAEESERERSARSGPQCERTASLSRKR